MVKYNKKKRKKEKLVQTSMLKGSNTCTFCNKTFILKTNAMWRLSKRKSKKFKWKK